MVLEVEGDQVKWDVMRINPEVQSDGIVCIGLVKKLFKVCFWVVVWSKWLQLVFVLKQQVSRCWQWKIFKVFFYVYLIYEYVVWCLVLNPVFIQVVDFIDMCYDVVIVDGVFVLGNVSQYFCFDCEGMSGIKQMDCFCVFGGFIVLLIYDFGDMGVFFVIWCFGYLLFLYKEYYDVEI